MYQRPPPTPVTPWRPQEPLSAEEAAEARRKFEEERSKPETQAFYAKVNADIQQRNAKVAEGDMERTEKYNREYAIAQAVEQQRGDYPFPIQEKRPDRVFNKPFGKYEPAVYEVETTDARNKRFADAEQKKILQEAKDIEWTEGAKARDAASHEKLLADRAARKKADDEFVYCYKTKQNEFVCKNWFRDGKWYDKDSHMEISRVQPGI